MKQSLRLLLQSLTVPVLGAAVVILNATGTLVTLRDVHPALPPVNTALILTILLGRGMLFDAIAGLLRFRLSADFAVALAAIAALSIREYLAAAEVVLILVIGEMLENFAEDRCARAVAKLVELLPRKARVIRDGKETSIDVDDVAVGDHVVVLLGERIPVDGCMLSGTACINEAPITGEPIAKHKSTGSEVYSGSINESARIEIEATTVGQDTLLARIIHLVREAEQARAPIQRFADRCAVFFVPSVLLLAAGTWYFKGLYQAVSVMVVCCPCALVLATPAAVVAGIGRLSRSRILVKGGAALEKAAGLDAVLFDKTGTLTLGQPAVDAIFALEGALDENAVLQLAASCERDSGHMLGQAVLLAARDKHLQPRVPEDVTITPGFGIKARVDDKMLHFGTPRFLQAENIEITESASAQIASLRKSGATLSVLAVDGKASGIMTFADRERPEAKSAIHMLHALDVHHIEMLTGDHEAAAAKVANCVGIRTWHSGLLPHEKASHIEALLRRGRRTAMVGDGINDAPSMAKADLGIAMGDLATEITAEAADVILATGQLERVPELISISRRVMEIVRQNMMLFGIGINLIGVGLAALAPWMTPVKAAVFHQSGSFLVILNSLRIFLIRGTASGVQMEASWLSQTRRWAGDLFARHRTRLGAAMPIVGLAAYLSSCFYRVQPDEVTLHQRFGRDLGRIERPGLHVKLPYPFDTIHRLKTLEVKRIEIGFRSNAGAKPLPGAAGTATEWNVTHQSGSYARIQDESLMLAGDQNMVDVNAVIQFRIHNPIPYMYTTDSPRRLLHAAGESVLRSLAARHSLADLLTDQRTAIEHMFEASIRQRMHVYQCGIEIISARLQDVHPPVEVVGSFREVASAMEDKDRMINEALGYQLSEVPLAQGKAAGIVKQAQAVHQRMVASAEGKRTSFVLQAESYQKQPDVTAYRIYLEFMEQTLPGITKYILPAELAGSRDLRFIRRNDPINPTVPSNRPSKDFDFGIKLFEE